MIIGIVDSGIWPEHPSFSDRTGSNGNGTKDGKLDYQQIPGWHGKCTPRRAVQRQRLQPEADRRAVLQRRLGRQRRHRRATFPCEFNSPRDWDGHGTHTATTAGGNANVAGHRPAAVVRHDQRHGAARPHRRLQGLLGRSSAGRRLLQRPTAWRRSTRPSPTAWTSSTSRSAARTTNFRDPVEIAFLFAADAGVFVAASAGNSGPTRRPSRTRALAHHGGRGHAQPRRRRLGDAGQRRDLHRRLGGGRAVVRRR